MKQLHKASREGRAAERALKRAVARVVEESRKLGLPVAVMHKGKAVLISAERAVSVVREERAKYSTKTRR